MFFWLVLAVVRVGVSLCVCVFFCCGGVMVVGARGRSASGLRVSYPVFSWAPSSENNSTSDLSLSLCSRNNTRRQQYATQPQLHTWMKHTDTGTGTREEINS